MTNPADDELEFNYIPPSSTTDKPRSTSSGSLLAAAMLGLAEVIEPEKTSVEIEQHDDSPDDDDFELDLSFGVLPPLS